MFLPRDDMLARYTLSSCVRLSVCPPVRLSQAGIYRNDWTNRADFDKDASFNLSRTVRKFGYFQKLRYLWDFVSKSVDRVVNKTRRRCRRRSSLLMTPSVYC